MRRPLGKILEAEGEGPKKVEIIEESPTHKQPSGMSPSVETYFPSDQISNTPSSFTPLHSYPPKPHKPFVTISNPQQKKPSKPFAPFKPSKSYEHEPSNPKPSKPYEHEPSNPKPSETILFEQPQSQPENSPSRHPIHTSTELIQPQNHEPIPSQPQPTQNENTPFKTLHYIHTSFQIVIPETRTFPDSTPSPPTLPPQPNVMNNAFIENLHGTYLKQFPLSHLEK
ncbi:extensin-like [Lathyrus oleraceus]|uniref:extensin-like n=1 Tax=Pisum sativum TaxID=3888 RepID=UPI0021D0845A|nr:extensin-like [Pisum sativum]